MYIPLGIKTDYSLLKSLIKVNDLMNFLVSKNITACGILDDNLFGTLCFYNSCLKNNIKPIIGLKIKVSEFYVYLYAKNYDGYLNLIKINTLMQERDVNYIDLKSLCNDVICVVPFDSCKIFSELKKIYDVIFVGYKNEFEKKNGLLLSNNIVYVNEICCFDSNDVKFINILREIDTGNKDNTVYSDNYFKEDLNDDDINSTINFSKMIDIVIPKNGKYIPHYDNSISDSYAYLSSLCKKGLDKRLNGNVTKEYSDRLLMELNVIKNMGFVDYFLIVFDYVKYAKTHNILVGPGRGSAAGSLVSYVLGITNIDPIKYDLLFERFLNPERITMPDIDIDFEDSKRDLVIDYVREKYGNKNVSSIMTFSTLSSKQVIRDVSKCLKIDNIVVDGLCNVIDPKLKLKDNLSKKSVSEYIYLHSELKKVYQICFKLEDLKKHISTHAAGVVISSLELDSIIPMCISNNQLLTGCTMEYLEDLGLLKMDFLALRNLSIIRNVLELIEKETGEKINLNDIDLDDKDVYELFKSVDTDGIFQFDTPNMKSFISKLKPSCFSDLVAALALCRPGPMQNIDTYIRRREGKEEIVYPDDSLKDILSGTYGILLYQEQIMQVLVKMGGYSFAEADNIRRAMSKKKHDVMEREREVFKERSIKNGYSEDKAMEVYDLIIRFADYGFNKAHSVSYALLGYQMAYLKAKYPIYFITSILNLSIGSDIKTKEYLDAAKRNNISIFKPNINISTDRYIIKNNALLLPLNTIKGVSSNIVNDIVSERIKNGRFVDFYNFVSRINNKSINRRVIELLIDGDCFRDFNFNHKTLFNNIDNALDYAILCSDLDESLVMKPNMIIEDEYSDGELMSKEIDTFGFYVTNHPASKYIDGIMKLKDIRNYFNKYVECVVIVSSVRKIKTKNAEDMGFITGNDETDSGDFIVFTKYSKYLDMVNKNDLVRIKGKVERRYDKYQVIVSSIEL